MSKKNNKKNNKEQKKESNANQKTKKTKTKSVIILKKPEEDLEETLEEPIQSSPIQLLSTTTPITPTLTSESIQDENLETQTESLPTSTPIEETEKPYSPNLYDNQNYESMENTEPEQQVQRAMRRSGTLVFRPDLQTFTQNQTPRAVSMSNPELEETRQNDEYMVRETESREEKRGLPFEQRDKKYRPLKR